MTTPHIREQIDAMSDEDRFFASAYLQHLSNEADPQHKATLAALEIDQAQERKRRFEANPKKHTYQE